jgi:uncharacterized membrane protein (DUF4010 family)
MFTGIIILLGVIVALVSRITGSETVFYVGLFGILVLCFAREFSLGRMRR